MSDRQGLGLLMGIWGFTCCMGVLVYLFTSLCIFKIAKKTGVDMAWLAWIPVIQVVPLVMASGKPLWWILLLFVPLLNIVIGIVIWMAVAERRGKPSWIGILIILPLVGFFVPAYLAFSE